MRFFAPRVLSHHRPADSRVFDAEAARARRGAGARWFMAVTALAMVAVIATMWLRPRASHASPAVHDVSLRTLPLYFYRPATPPRAMVFFFGNDVGYWAAHEALAERYAADGIAVAGFDVRQWMSELPTDNASRATAFTMDLPRIIDRARHELGADSVPLVLGGHSIGAELALYVAARDCFDNLAGVLAMSPGERGHLRSTIDDLAEREPTEPGSFAVADVIASIPSDIRVALVRGSQDALGKQDSVFTRVGGARLHRYVVPLAGHSMKRLTIAGPVISSATQFLLQR